MVNCLSDYSHLQLLSSLPAPWSGCQMVVARSTHLYIHSLGLTLCMAAKSTSGPALTARPAGVVLLAKAANWCRDNAPIPTTPSLPEFPHSPCALCPPWLWSASTHPRGEGKSWQTAVTLRGTELRHHRGQELGKRTGWPWQQHMEH